MKKALTITLAAVLAVALLCGCMGMEDPVESMMPDMGQNNNSNNQTQDSQNANDNQQQTQSTVDTSKFIGEEKAKEMALSRAGISAEGVTFDKVDLGLDDGVWRYEVEFRKDNVEYDAEVKADDGAVLEFEKDTID